MRGVSMPERVDADPLGELQLGSNLADWLLHRGGLKGNFSDRGLAVIASLGGKQKSLMPMRCPVSSQQLERRSWQRYVSILGALAAMNVDHHPLAVDIADLLILLGEWGICFPV